MQPSDMPTAQPTYHPSVQPSVQPSSQPSGQPSSEPSGQPSGKPSIQPTGAPSAQPSGTPTNQPSSAPSDQPTSLPTEQPSGNPSTQPSVQPSGQPSIQPSSQPTTEPSGQPSSWPSSHPSDSPSTCPSVQPSESPTTQPTSQPSRSPTKQPSSTPSSQPSRFPTKEPTSRPSGQPTTRPSSQPSSVPSMQPSGNPSIQPTGLPSSYPTAVPSRQPSCQPSSRPTIQPTSQPSVCPSGQPTKCPSLQPTSQPSGVPSQQPTSQPTVQPTAVPSSHPTDQPTSGPTRRPTAQPSSWPSSSPTAVPTSAPTGVPTSGPTGVPKTLAGEYYIWVNTTLLVFSCPEGWYAPPSTMGHCFPSPPGYVAAAGSAYPSQCEVNTYANSKQTACKKCRSGYVSVVGSTKRTDCVREDISLVFSVTAFVTSAGAVVKYFHYGRLFEMARKRSMTMLLASTLNLQMLYRRSTFMINHWEENRVPNSLLWERIKNSAILACGVLLVITLESVKGVTKLFYIAIIFRNGFLPFYPHFPPILNQFLHYVDVSVVIPKALAEAEASVYSSLSSLLSFNIGSQVSCIGAQSMIYLLLNCMFIVVVLMVNVARLEVYWMCPLASAVDANLSVLQNLEHWTVKPDSDINNCFIRFLDWLYRWCRRCLFNCFIGVVSIAFKVAMPHPSSMIQFGLTFVQLYAFVQFRYSIPCNVGRFLYVDQGLSILAAGVAFSLVCSTVLILTLTIVPKFQLPEEVTILPIRRQSSFAPYAWLTCKTSVPSWLGVFFGSVVFAGDLLLVKSLDYAIIAPSYYMYDGCGDVEQPLMVPVLHDPESTLVKDFFARYQSDSMTALTPHQMTTLVLTCMISDKEDVSVWRHCGRWFLRKILYLLICILGPLVSVWTSAGYHIWRRVAINLCSYGILSIGILNSQVCEQYYLRVEFLQNTMTNAVIAEAKKLSGSAPLYYKSVVQDENLKLMSAIFAPKMTLLLLLPGCTIWAVYATLNANAPLYVTKEHRDDLPPLWYDPQHFELAMQTLQVMKVQRTPWSLFWIEIHLLVNRGRGVQYIKNIVLIVMAALLIWSQLNQVIVIGNLTFWAGLALLGHIDVMVQKCFPSIPEGRIEPANDEEMREDFPSHDFVDLEVGFIRGLRRIETTAPAEEEKQDHAKEDLGTSCGSGTVITDDQDSHSPPPLSVEEISLSHSSSARGEGDAAVLSSPQPAVSGIESLFRGLYEPPEPPFTTLASSPGQDYKPEDVALLSDLQIAYGKVKQYKVSELLEGDSVKWNEVDLQQLFSDVLPASKT